MKKAILVRVTALILTALLAVSILPGFVLKTHAEVRMSDTASAQLEQLFTTIDLMDATIADLQEEMEAGNLTSVQLCEMYLRRIKAYDEKLKLNSIISINRNAIQDAAVLDQERSEGRVRGPLHGIPIIVKANYDVEGMPTSAGSNALAHMIAPEDAFVIKKLRDAGAVILANANMSEFASSAADSKSTLGGFVHNAYDGRKTPAGSSGGTGVAVTCNFAAAGLGTDTGGSIRNPSSFSNLYGIRPSKGLTSIHGVIPLAGERDTVGPMARTAEDLALLLQTMAGSDPQDDYTLESDADALLGDGYMASLSPDALKGKRIGYLENSFSYEVIQYDDEGEQIIKKVEPNARIKAMINKARANLRKAGATFVDLSNVITREMILPFWGAAADPTTEYDLNKYLYEKGEIAPYKTMKDLILSGVGIMNTNLGDSVADLADSFEETENPYTETIGNFKRGATWQASLNGREQISKILKENNIDAVMYLSYFNVVPDDDSIGSAWENGTYYDFYFGSALGLPDISLPMGFSDSDDPYQSEMPLGLSLFSSFGNEKTLMEIAYAYEQQAGDYIRRMPQRTPALSDQSMNDFLSDLMEKVYSIDYSKYNKKPEGKVQLMLNAYDKAKHVDTKDPYAVYDAASELAAAYDKVIAALEQSGLVKTANKITVATSAKTIRYAALSKKAQSFQIKATAKGGAKLSFKKVAAPKEAEKYIAVSSTGKVTVKKGLKKGTYQLKVQVTSSKTAEYKKTSVNKQIKITVK